MDAPKPSISWYDRSGSTVMVGWSEVPTRKSTGARSRNSSARSTVVTHTRALG